MTQKTYQTFPYVPLEISTFESIYGLNGAANPYNKISEKDYMNDLEKYINLIINRLTMILISQRYKILE